eukprot:CAMPEP_0197456076 /NCGR_PEP_ID=MMETSP1175-20131217/42436_1 /TAXON_ID=1003142 /ORGANISM="Triceratium dubium, Strain CCMP147" /LENGTH=75 /DNA_ID=CAMNT_0042990093 /DNA_START=20 /DNA_END=243 /DNA_ORIENTATION=-
MTVPLRLRSADAAPASPAAAVVAVVANSGDDEVKLSAAVAAESAVVGGESPSPPLLDSSRVAEGRELPSRRSPCT